MSEQIKQRVQGILDANKITFEWSFVPFSLSRNRKEKNPSLNWKVKVLKNGREIAGSDYMMGFGHCPSYSPGPMTIEKDEIIRKECQTGHRHTSLGTWTARKIDPDILSFLSCLLMDARAIDYPDFEAYAKDTGGNPDSIREKESYEHCIKIGLNLRAGLGEKLLAELTEAMEGY